MVEAVGVQQNVKPLAGTKFARPGELPVGGQESVKAQSWSDLLQLQQVPSEWTSTIRWRLPLAPNVNHQLGCALAVLLASSARQKRQDLKLAL